jgi:hypothetical protein
MTSPSIFKRFKTGFAAALAVSALALPAVLTPVSAATVSRVDIGDPSTTALLYRGEVVEGDLGRLKAEVAKVAPGQRIVLMLHSGGGLVDEGLAIGRYVYANKITTAAINVPGTNAGCASACTFIFVAGRDASSGNPMRIMMSGARIGFHQISSSSPNANPNQQVSAAAAAQQQTGVQTAIAKLEVYFREIDVDREFLTLTLSAPANSLTFLREFDALRLGIFVMDPSTGRLITPTGFRQQLTAR